MLDRWPEGPAVQVLTSGPHKDPSARTAASVLSRTNASALKTRVYNSGRGEKTRRLMLSAGFSPSAARRMISAVSVVSANSDTESRGETYICVRRVEFLWGWRFVRSRLSGPFNQGKHVTVETMMSSSIHKNSGELSGDQLARPSAARPPYWRKVRAARVSRVSDCASAVEADDMARARPKSVSRALLFCRLGVRRPAPLERKSPMATEKDYELELTCLIEGETNTLLVTLPRTAIVDELRGVIHQRGQLAALRIRYLDLSLWKVSLSRISHNC